MPISFLLLAASANCPHARCKPRRNSTATLHKHIMSMLTFLVQHVAPLCSLPQDEYASCSISILWWNDNVLNGMLKQGRVCMHVDSAYREEIMNRLGGLSFSEPAHVPSLGALLLSCPASPYFIFRSSFLAFRSSRHPPLKIYLNFFSLFSWWSGIWLFFCILKWLNDLEWYHRHIEGRSYHLSTEKTVFFTAESHQIMAPGGGRQKCI